MSSILRVGMCRHVCHHPSHSHDDQDTELHYTVVTMPQAELCWLSNITTLLVQIYKCFSHFTNESPDVLGEWTACTDLNQGWDWAEIKAPDWPGSDVFIFLRLTWCVWMFACRYIHAPNVYTDHGGQKRVSAPLDQELWTMLNCYVCSRNQTLALSVRAASALSYWALYPVTRLNS